MPSKSLVHVGVRRCHGRHDADSAVHAIFKETWVMMATSLLMNGVNEAVNDAQGKSTELIPAAGHFPCQVWEDSIGIDHAICLVSKAVQDRNKLKTVIIKSQAVRSAHASQSAEAVVTLNNLVKTLRSADATTTRLGRVARLP